MPLARSCLLSLLLAVAFDVSSHAQTPPKREFRAAWVATVANLDWPSTRGFASDQQKAELVAILDGLDRNGISAAVFQIRSECDAMYASPFEPWSYYLTGSQGSAPVPLYDPLEFAVEETHVRGMELHAWFNPYRVYRQTNTYRTAPSHVSNVHPEWVITCPDGYKFLDPGLPQVREFVASIVADVVRRYDVDGIHMDDYFYPYPEHQFTNEDAATFATYPRGFSNLGNWRRDNVNLLLRMIRDSLDQIKPHVKFGMSPFGIWKSGVPPGISGLDAYSTIYCDGIAWLREQSIDYLTPQMYWVIGGNQDFSKLLAWWGDSTAFYDRHFYPGQAAYRINSHNWPATEILNQIRLTRANPHSTGSMFFRAEEGINDNPKGLADSLRLDLYRYPALHPVMAWKDSVRPYPPRGIRFEYHPEAGKQVVQWDLPLTAPDGDSASRYAVYRFDHYPTLAELDDPRNMLAVEGRRYAVAPDEPAGTGPYYFTVTALDRNYNESDTSNMLVLTAPSVPLLAAPADGTPMIPDTVQVVWLKSPLASSYRLQVASEPSFSGELLLDEPGLVDTFRVLSSLIGQATHYWRVSATGPGGSSAFATAFSFTTGFPSSVALVQPADYSLDVPVDATLLWNRAAGATSYDVQLSVQENFASTVVDTSGISDTSLAVATLNYSRVYYWRVRAENALGMSPWSEIYRFRTVQLTAVKEDEGIPERYVLEQNYPNPFNAMTTIEFALPQEGRVRLAVFDLLGREREVLVDRLMRPGTYRIQWDATSAASGTYFYRLDAGGFVATKRMVLLK